MQVQVQVQGSKIVTTVWLSGTGRYPTLRVPRFLAQQCCIDKTWIAECKEKGKPAQIELIYTSEGILLRKYDTIK